MTAAALRERIGGDWRERADGWWATVDRGRVRGAARSCLEAGARFSALLACPGEAGALRLSWHWDLGGTLLSMCASLEPGTAAPSIADLCPAADWAERETHDYYAVDFEGRAETPPLVLRGGEQPGVMLEPRAARHRP